MNRLAFAGCFLLLLLSSSLRAQHGTVTGRITDSSGKNPLSLSTISVFKAKDTVLITYRLSNENGEFSIGNLPMNQPLRLLVGFSGYEPFRKEFTFSQGKTAQLELGNIKLNYSAKQLDEVIVVAERPPVVVRKDTVEFNAASFKTLPNAVVEDLFRKIPGMQIDQDGNMLMNGKRVNKITVDGKSFFGNDTKMATKNLPSALIDKVQVTDDKDEIAENNDGDLSKVGKVINLTMKKHIKRKWFGKFSGGLGTDERYNLNANVNVMKDTFQLNMVGAASNFTSQYGQGITPGTNRNISTNLNYTPSKKLSLSGQYSYRNSRSDLLSQNETQQFLSDTVIINNNASRSVNNTHGHTLSASGNWRPDTLTYLNFRANYNRNDYNRMSSSSVTVNNNLLGALSKGDNQNRNLSGSDNITESVSLSHRSRKHKGRSISLSQNFTYNHAPADFITESVNDYFYPVAGTRIINQLRNSNSPSTVLGIGGNYSDQLTKKWILRANSRFEYNKRAQDVLTYAKSSSNKYDSLDNTLSSSLQREQLLWSSMAGLGYRINKVTVSLNANWTQQWINNSFGLGGLFNAKQYYSTLFPSFTVNWSRYNFSLSRNLNIPDISQLTPVPDNSNPYYIRYGNPDLLPTKHTSISFNGSYYDVKTSTNIGGLLSASITDNSIIQKVVINSDGVQTSIPVNTDGSYSGYGYLYFSRQFRSKQKFFLTVNGNISGNISRRPIFFNGVQGIAKSLDINPSLGILLNWNDRILFNPKYDIRINKSSYSNQAFNRVDIIVHNLGGDITLRPTKRIILQSNATYRYNGQFASGSNKSIINWNAAISTLLFREDQGQLKLDIYDVLNSNTNFSSYISGNSIVKNQSTILQRFFLLSFIYNIKPITAGKQARVEHFSVF